MNVYLVERKDKIGWEEDRAMVVIASDRKRAERCARWSSDNFRNCKAISIHEISLDVEQCVLKDNTGA